MMRLFFPVLLLLSCLPAHAGEFYRDNKNVPDGWTIRGTDDLDVMCSAGLKLQNGSSFSVTKDLSNKVIGVFLGVRNAEWNYPATDKADKIDMMGLSYDEDGKLLVSGKLLGVLLSKDTVSFPVPPATAYRILGRSAKLKIIPPNGKDRDFVVDGLGSRAVINSLLACFDAAQGVMKGKKKGRG